MNCPNCEGSLVDGLCTCGHDGNREDCGCEYCSEPATSDLVPIMGYSALASCAKWIAIEDDMQKALQQSFWQNALPFSDDEPWEGYLINDWKTINGFDAWVGNEDWEY